MTQPEQARDEFAAAAYCRVIYGMSLEDARVKQPRWSAISLATARNHRIVADALAGFDATPMETRLPWAMVPQDQRDAWVRNGGADPSLVARGD